MEEILREILKADKSLLCRRDDLVAILDKKVPGRLMREYTPLKRALMLNVGEIFAIGNSDRESAINKATEILKQSGLQENKIKNVIDLFVKVLDWDKEETAAIEEEAQEDLENADWMEPESEDEEELGDKEVEKNATPSPTQQASNKSNISSAAPPMSSQPQPQSQSQPQPQQSSQPIPPSPVQQQPTTQTSNNSKILIGIIVFLVFVLISVLQGKDNSSNQNSTSTSTATKQVETEASQPPQQRQPEPEPYLNARSDLSLNGVDLGLPLNEVTSIFGTPNSTKTESDGHVRYYYNDIEVVFKDNYLSAFVTRSPKYKTYRGINVGSTYSEVINKYGPDSADMDYEDLILHEYKFTSIKGENGLLRFAVNKSDNHVNYISMRILYPEPEKPTPKQNDIPENVKQAAQTFVEYHNTITAGNYRQAYNMLTSSRQNSMGSLSDYTQGFTDTISSEVSDLKLISNDGDSVTLAYTLDAKDRARGGKFLYQRFQGQVEMIKVGNSWKINAGKSRKVSENIK